MKKLNILLVVSSSLFSAAAVANVITLDFEGAGDSAQLLNFYNGGTDSMGNSGVNYGVQFGSNALSSVDVDSDVFGSGNFANEPSPSTTMFFLSGSAILNYAAGFDTGFSFYYSSAYAAVVNVYDGLNASGTLLGSISLSQQYNDNCTGDPSGTFCNWSVGSLAFSGIAMSIDYGGTVNQVGYDNITFGSTTPGNTTVPVPAAAWLLGSGLVGLIGISRRKPA